MKTRLSLFALAALLCSAPAMAQTPAAPGKKAAATGSNAIFILLPVGGDSAWVHVARTLFRHHFAIQHSDKTLGTMSTHDLYDANFKRRLSVSVLITGRVVTLHGIEKLGGDAGYPQAVSLRGGNPKEWEMLDAIARSIGSNISYGVQ